MRLHCSLVQWQCGLAHSMWVFFWTVANFGRIEATRLKMPNPCSSLRSVRSETDLLGTVLYCYNSSWRVWKCAVVAKRQKKLAIPMFHNQAAITIAPPKVRTSYFFHCKWTLLTVDSNSPTNFSTSCKEWPCSLPKTMAPICQSLTSAFRPVVAPVKESTCYYRHTAFCNFCPVCLYIFRLWFLSQIYFSAMQLKRQTIVN